MAMLTSSDLGFSFWSWTWSDCELSCIQNWELFQNDRSSIILWQHLLHFFGMRVQHQGTCVRKLELFLAQNTMLLSSFSLPCFLTHHFEQAHQRLYYLFINWFIRPPTQIMQLWAVYVAASGRITTLTHKPCTPVHTLIPFIHIHIQILNSLYHPRQ